MKLDIEAAKKELKEKGEEQIEHDTAVKWASRAAAAYEMCLDADSDSERVKFFSWGDDLCHEAMEHAALSHEISLVSDIKGELDPRRKKCQALFEKKEKPVLGKRITARVVAARLLD